MLKVLVGCECSQVVTSAFLEYGQDAYSCDLLPCRGPHPERHFQCDLFSLVSGDWDLLIAHPPCTYLSRLNGPLIRRDPSRVELGFKAAAFLLSILDLPIPYIAVENPPPLSLFGLPRPDFKFRFSDFGDDSCKLEYFWLKNLPPLMYGCVNLNPSIRISLISSDRSYRRSIFYPGVSSAMARQWTDFILAKEG